MLSSREEEAILKVSGYELGMYMYHPEKKLESNRKIAQWYSLVQCWKSLRSVETLRFVKASSILLAFMYNVPVDV
jgi:hypothetical protein